MFQGVLPLFGQHADRVQLSEGDRLRIPVPQPLRQQFANNPDLLLRLQFLPAFQSDRNQRYQPSQFLLSNADKVQTLFGDVDAGKTVKIYDLANANDRTNQYNLALDDGTGTAIANNGLEDVLSSAIYTANPAMFNNDRQWFFYESDVFRTLDHSGWYVVDALLDRNPQNPSDGKRWRYISSLVVEGRAPPTITVTNPATPTSLTDIVSSTVRQRYNYQFVVLGRRDVLVSCAPYLDTITPGSILSGASYDCVVRNPGRGRWDAVEMDFLSEYLFTIDQATVEKVVAWDRLIEDRLPTNFPDLPLYNEEEKIRARSILFALTGRPIDLVGVLYDYETLDPSKASVITATGALGRAWKESEAPWLKLKSFVDIEAWLLEKINVSFQELQDAVIVYKNEGSHADGVAAINAVDAATGLPVVLLAEPLRVGLLAVANNNSTGPKTDIDDALDAWYAKLKRNTETMLMTTLDRLRRAISTATRSGYVWKVARRSNVNAAVVPGQLLSATTELYFSKYRSANETVSTDTEVVLLSYNSDVAQLELQAGDGQSSFSLNTALKREALRWIKVSDDPEVGMDNIQMLEIAINRELNRTIINGLAAPVNAPIFPDQESVLRQLYANRGIYLSVERRGGPVDRPDSAVPAPTALTFPLFPLRSTRLVRWGFVEEDLGAVPLGYTLTIDAGDLLPETVAKAVWQLATPRSDPSRYAYNAKYCAEGSRSIVVRPVDREDFGEYVLLVTVATGDTPYAARFRISQIPDANCIEASRPIGFVANELATYYGQSTADGFAYEQPHRYRFARDLDNIVRYYRVDQQPNSSAPFSLLYDDLRYIPGVDRKLAPPYLRYHPPTTVLGDDDRQFVIFNHLSGQWEYFQLSKDSLPLNRLEEEFQRYLQTVLAPLVDGLVDSNTINNRARAEAARVRNTGGNAAAQGAAARASRLRPITRDDVQVIGLRIQDLTESTFVAGKVAQVDLSTVQRTLGALAIEYFEKIGEQQRRGVNVAIQRSEGASADPYTGLPIAFENLKETVPGILAPEKMLPTVSGATRVQSFATWIEDRANAFELYLEAENSLVDLSTRRSTALVLANEVPIALLLVWLDRWASIYRQQNRFSRAALLSSVHRQMQANFETFMRRVDRGSLMEAASVRGGARFESDQMFWLPYSDSLPQDVRDSLYLYGGVNAINAYENLDEKAKSAWSPNSVSFLYSLGVNKNTADATRFFSVNKDGRRLFTDFDLWRYTVTINDLLISGPRLLVGSTNVNQRSTLSLLSAPYPNRTISLYASNPAFRSSQAISRSAVFDYRAADDDELEQALRFFEIEVPQNPAYCSAMDDAVESYRRTVPAYHEPSKDSRDAIEANMALAGNHLATFDDQYAQSITGTRPNAHDWATETTNLVNAAPDSRRATDSTGSVLGIYHGERQKPQDGTIAYHPGAGMDDPTGQPVPTVMPSSLLPSNAVVSMMPATSSASLRASLLDALKAEYGSEILKIDAKGMDSFLGTKAVPSVSGIPNAILYALTTALTGTDITTPATDISTELGNPVPANEVDAATENGKLAPLIIAAENAITAIRVTYDPVVARETQLNQPQRATFGPIKTDYDALEQALADAKARRAGNDKIINEADAVVAIGEIEALEPKPPAFLDSAGLTAIASETAPINVEADLRDLAARLQAIANYETNPAFTDFKAALIEPARVARLAYLPAAEQARLVAMQDRETELESAIAAAKARAPALVASAGDTKAAQDEFAKFDPLAQVSLARKAAIDADIPLLPLDEKDTPAKLANYATELGAIQTAMAAQKAAMDALVPNKARLATGDEDKPGLASAALDTAITAIPTSIANAKAREKLSMDELKGKASAATQLAVTNLENLSDALVAKTAAIEDKIRDLPVTIDLDDLGSFNAAMDALRTEKDAPVPDYADAADLKDAVEAAVTAAVGTLEEVASDAAGKAATATFDANDAAYRKAFADADAALDAKTAERIDLSKARDAKTIKDAEEAFLTKAEPLRELYVDTDLQGVYATINAGDPLNDAQMEDVTKKLDRSRLVDFLSDDIPQLASSRVDIEAKRQAFKDNPEYGGAEVPVMEDKATAFQDFYNVFDEAYLKDFANLMITAVEDTEKKKTQLAEAERMVQKLAGIMKDLVTRQINAANTAKEKSKRAEQMASNGDFPGARDLVEAADKEYTESNEANLERIQNIVLADPELREFSQKLKDQPQYIQDIVNAAGEGGDEADQEAKEALANAYYSAFGLEVTGGASSAGRLNLADMRLAAEEQKTKEEAQRRQGEWEQAERARLEQERLEKEKRDREERERLEQEQRAKEAERQKVQAETAVTFNAQLASLEEPVQNAQQAVLLNDPNAQSLLDSARADVIGFVRSVADAESQRLLAPDQAQDFATRAAALRDRLDESEELLTGGAGSSQQTPATSGQGQAGSSSGTSAQPLSQINYSIEMRPALASSPQKWVNSLYQTTDDGLHRTIDRWEQDQILNSVYGTTVMIDKAQAKSIVDNPDGLTFNGTAVQNAYIYDPLNRKFGVFEGDIKDKVVSQAYEGATLTLGMIDPERAPFTFEEYFGDDSLSPFNVLNPGVSQPKLVVLGVSNLEEPTEALIGAKPATPRKGRRSKKGTPGSGKRKLQQRRQNAPGGKAVRQLQPAESSSSETPVIDTDQPTIHLLVIPPWGNLFRGFKLGALAKDVRENTCVFDDNNEPVCTISRNIHRPFHTMYTEDDKWADIEERQRKRGFLTPKALNPAINKNDAKVAFGGTTFISYENDRLSYPHGTFIIRKSEEAIATSMYVGSDALPKNEQAVSETGEDMPAVAMYKLGFNASNQRVAASEEVITAGQTSSGTTYRTYMRPKSINYCVVNKAGIGGTFLSTGKHGLLFRRTDGKKGNQFANTLASKVGVTESNETLLSLSDNAYKDNVTEGVDVGKFVTFFGSPDGTTCIDQPDFFTTLMTDGLANNVVYSEDLSKPANLRSPTDANEPNDKMPTWIASEIQPAFPPTTDLLSFTEDLSVAASSSTPVEVQEPSGAAGAMSDFFNLFGFGKQ